MEEGRKNLVIQAGYSHSEVKTCGPCSLCNDPSDGLTSLELWLRPSGDRWQPSSLKQSLLHLEKLLDLCLGVPQGGKLMGYLFENFG